MENGPPAGLPQRQFSKRRYRNALAAQKESCTNIAEPSLVCTEESGASKMVSKSLEDEKDAGSDVVKIQDFRFEYLDHTADVQIHSWGVSVTDAFCQAALGMFNYMTPLEGIKIGVQEKSILAEGHDLQSMLFGFLDEFLFVFHTEMLVCREIEVIEFDRENWKMRARGSGEVFDRKRHESGTEVKAITYSAMQVIEGENGSEVFVIVDI